MSIDMTQFHDIFFEESLECLDAMQSALLELDVDNLDIAKVTTACRGAHTIKGNGATFGFLTISEFAKVLEKLLALVRDGQQTTMTKQNVTAFLDAVEFLREMVITSQNKQETSQEIAQQQITKIQTVFA